MTTIGKEIFEKLIEMEDVIVEAVAAREETGVYLFEHQAKGEGCKHLHFIYPIIDIQTGYPTMNFNATLVKPSPAGYEKSREGESVPLAHEGIKNVSGLWCRSIAVSRVRKLTKEELAREVNLAIDELVTIAA